MDMNKINIIQPVPKRACECSVDTCTYCKYKAPHPSPMPSDWSSEDWDGETAKAREQRSLIDLNPPRPNLRQTTDSEILNELLIENLTIQEGRKEEEKSPEITDKLVPSRYVLKSTPRPKHWDGGIALNIRDSIEIIANIYSFKSMECTSYELNTLSRPVYFNVIYRKK